MSDNWTNEIERLTFATFERGMRVVGVTSPQAKSGVSSVCRRLCEVMAKSGGRTLLVDLSGSTEESTGVAAWRPGTGGAGQSIRTDAAGYDRLVAAFDQETRYLFNSIDRLRRVFAEDLAHYDAIVLDMPSLPATGTSRLNGAPAAAACDGVLMVCLSGDVSREQLNAAVDALANVEAKLLGMVLNDMTNPTLGAELAREARRVRRYLPRLSGWLERKALASALLN